MRKFKRGIIVLLLAFMAAGSYAQVKRANAFYNKSDYPNAIKLYTKALKGKGENQEALEKLANCYRLTKNYEQAEVYYAKACGSQGADPLMHFYYGIVLKNNKKYDEAKKEFNAYSKLAPSDKNAQVMVKNTDEVKEIITRPPQYMVRNVAAANTKNAEFSPTVFKNDLVFVGEKTTDLLNFEKYARNNEPFLNVYVAEVKKDKDSIKYKNPHSFSGSINSQYHDGPVCFSSDDTFMILTRVNALNKKQKDFVNRAKLYRSDYEKSSWSKPELLPFCSDNYSVAHPSLSADGKMLYFTSDMPGGFGGKDLYVVKKEGSSWGKPENLGAGINTPGDEVFPYIRNDGVLFFSSDGHAGVGGLDIFSAKQTSGKWGSVSNQGIPLNSSTDDFGVVFTENNSRGYFSSDRKGGSGSDDIYSFMVSNRFITMKGKILTSANMNDGARNAKLTLLTEDGKVVNITTTDGGGFFKFDNLDPDTKYLLKIDENDPAFKGIRKLYLAADKPSKLVGVTVINDKGERFVFRNLPADINALAQLEVKDENTFNIAGNLLSGENPSKPLADVKVNLFNDKGEKVQSTTTNTFGAFVFTNLPPEENFVVKVDENDSRLPPNTKIIFTNKSGKDIKVTTTGTKGEFRFQILSADKSTLSLIKVEDIELRYDMKGSFLGDDKSPIAGTKVNLLNENGQVIQSTTTDAKGGFLFTSLPADQNFVVALDENDTRLSKFKKLFLLDAIGNIVREIFGKDGKFKFTLLQSEQRKLGPIYVDDPWLKVLKLKTDVNTTKKDSLTIIENIYYNVDAWNILPAGEKILDKVAQVMKADGEINIEVSSHTDSRATDEYNMTLSQKRAKAAVDYIVARGVPASRLQSVGYGESKLINRCKNGVECNDEEHAKNRRTEFKVIRKQK